MPSDADYMAAVKAGDTAKAQEMVDQAAEAAGYKTIRVYHGRRKDFNVFDARKGSSNEIRDAVRTPQFFSLDKDFAESYSEAFGKGKGKPNVVETYLRYKKLWDYRDPESIGAAVAAGFDANQLEEGDWRYTESPKFQQWLKDEGYDAFTNWEQITTNIAVFSPEQIKKADPVTRLRSGKIIPLSERFNIGNPDIRYMADASVPGAYTFTGGYRALPGKAKGSLRIYGPAGDLVGIASALDEAERIIRRRSR